MGGALVGVALLALVPGFGGEAAAGGQGPKTELASRQSKSKGGAGANASSYPSRISGNGRFVGFTSEATNLGGPVGAMRSAYLYDRKLDRLTLLARRGRRKANGESVIEDLSANGRYAVFSTDATNLGGPIQGDANVYVYDLRRDRIALVSRRSGRPGAGANGDSFDASISDDGRFVAFTTSATNLGGGPTAALNVYVYDREKRRVRLISRASGPGGAPGDDDSGRPSISADGRLVAFETAADNLGGPAADVDNVYVYDRKAKRAALISRLGGTGGDDDSDNPEIAAGGRVVTFRTFAQNLGGPIQTAANVYAYDRRRGRLELISRSGGATGEGANAVSYHGAVSADGRYVAFDTEATNLGGPLTNDAGDGNIYLHDRKSDRVTLLSRRSGRSGAGATGSSFNPSISSSGRFVSFDSDAGNLSAAAVGPPFSSVYVRDRGG